MYINLKFIYDTIWSQKSCRSKCEIFIRLIKNPFQTKLIMMELTKVIIRKLIKINRNSNLARTLIEHLCPEHSRDHVGNVAK